MIRTALDLAARGFAIFPCHSIVAGRCSCGYAGCDSPGKHPYTNNGFLDASKDPAQIKKWWRRWPDANIAISTGAESGVFVLDVDVKRDGRNSLADLETMYGALPATLMAATGGGGDHYFYRYTEKIADSRDAIGDGLEIKSDGGYVIAAPSTHISGCCYEWREAPIVDPPSWLVTLANEALRGGKPRGREYWREVANGVALGSRNDTCASLVGHLLRRGVQPKLTEMLVLAWNAQYNEPPLDDDEVSRTIESVATKEARRRGIRL